jgi:hypothetical protein
MLHSATVFASTSSEIPIPSLDPGCTCTLMCSFRGSHQILNFESNSHISGTSPLTRQILHTIICYNTPSLRQITPIHRQHTPMHKTTPPPQQPNNPLRNLLRQPKPPHRRPILHLIQRVPSHLARRIRQQRLDVPRRDGVDLDVGVVEGRVRVMPMTPCLAAV